MKKSIKAEIIADSLSPQNHRLTTFVVTFPRIVLAEFNTHRMFSRNSASSRAIPFEKMVKMVQEDPFIPVAWQEEHIGMQGTKYLEEDTVACFVAKKTWLKARDYAVKEASELSDERMANVTKQLCNRLLEPFMWHTAIITSHEFENFFHLRCPQYLRETRGQDFYFRSRKDFITHLMNVEKVNRDVIESYEKEINNDLFWLQLNKGGAEIHISLLAEKMWDAYNESKPKQLQAGEWHIPFGDKFDENRIYNIVSDNGKKMFFMHPANEIEQIKLKIVSARCARVSYINYEGKDDYEADLKLFERLVVQEPIHASPVEHCARAMSEREYEASSVICLDHKITELLPNYSIGWSGNFRGFIQYRKMFKNENKR